MVYFDPYKIRHFLPPWRSDAEGRAKHDYRDIEGRVTQEQLPRMPEPRMTSTAIS